ncbi:MAG TPA: ECF-type sigma factor [Rubricoccaceae bacterium]|jgi:RNA polymerase sigma factor (TIGR02999 family)
MPRPPVTALLAASHGGDADAAQRLVAAVYDELRAIARSERRGHTHDTLNTTALVHEAYAKLVDGQALRFNGRGHFFGAAARAMRQVLVDDARARTRLKRGGAERPIALDDAPEVAATDAFSDGRSDEVLAIDAALLRFAALDPRAARVVECRYFGGLSVEETAEALGISEATVKRDWTAARLWLFQALSDGDARS